MLLDPADRKDSSSEASDANKSPSNPGNAAFTPPEVPSEKPVTPSFSDAPTFCTSDAAKPSDPPTFSPDAAAFLQELGLGESLTSLASSVAQTLPNVPGYDVIERLGQGGMGVVFRAVDQRLKRHVAVKMIRATQATPLDIARFAAEAVAVAAIRHPNVVQVFGSGRHEGDPFFVMEHLANGPLTQRLAKGPLGCQEAVALISRLATGVHAAHNAGLIHRDIKPGNVLFDEKGVPKLTDFGLAKHGSSTLTHTEAMLGTPAYMAPEQAEGRAKFVGPAADIYALGVILYECIAGRRPFVKEDRWALLREVQFAPPPPPSQFVPTIPRDLELICLKCLEKNPADRYPSAEALAEDLIRFERGEAVSVRPPSVFLRTYRWACRDPKAAGLVAILVLVMAAAMIGWDRQESRLAVEKALLAASEIRHQDELQDELKARQAAEELAQAKGRIAEAFSKARDDAERAKVAADRLTRNHSLLALLDRTRHWSQSRRYGWTWAIADEVEKVDALPLAHPIVIRHMRSVLADVALNADFRVGRVVSSNMIPGAIATSSAGPWLAVAEKRPVSMLTAGVISIIDTVTGRGVRNLTYNPGFVRKESMLDLDTVQHLRFSRDGLRLFAATSGGWIFRFDLARPESNPDLVWNTHGGALRQLEVSADDRRIYALFSKDHALRVFEQSGEAVPLPHARFPVSTLAVHPLHSDLLTTSSVMVRRLDAETLTCRPEVLTRLRSHLHYAVFSRDGRFLIGSSGTTILLMDSESLAVKGEFVDPVLRRASHQERISSLELSPSGEFLASACDGADRNVKVWQVGTERLVGSVVIPGPWPIRLAWSPDSRFLYATGSNETLSFELRSSPIQTLVGEQSELVDRAAFTAGGEGYATLSQTVPTPVPPQSIVTRGWFDTLCPREQVTTPSQWQHAMSFAVRPGQSEVLVASRTGIRLWKPEGAVLATPFASGTMRLTTFDATGQSIWAVKDRTAVAVWNTDAAAGPPRCLWNARSVKSLRGPFSLESLAVGREHAVVGASDGAIHLLDARTLELRSTLGHLGDAATSIAIHPDDKLAVVGTQNGSVSILDLEAGQETATLAAHAGSVTAVAFSHDGRFLVAGSNARSLRLWMRKGSSYEQVLVVESLPAGVRDLRFSPVDDRLMVVLDQERVVRMWDIARLQDHMTSSRLGW